MKFELSVPYCLHNKVCILENYEKKVCFGLVDEKNQKLKSQLENSVRRFYQIDEENIFDFCRFEKIGEDELKKFVSFSYGKSEKNESSEISENVRKTGNLEKPEIRNFCIKNNSSNENAAALLLDSLIKQACDFGATDIHIEENLVRFRVNGFLEKICTLSFEKGRELVRRVKVLSKLDLMETRCAQDGQFVHKGESLVFVRVSCVPAVSRFIEEKSKNAGENSENLVLRLLDVGKHPLELEKLGFSESQCTVLRWLLNHNDGLILICGATGIGKSTTAASLLLEIGKIWQGRKKIVSIEDPPEYALENVTQIKVDEKFGMSFSDSLRFVFRQDPDVIFIGEIRDEKSAKTAIQASITGHLVFATVHAGGIEECVLRIKELGAEVSLLKAVIRGIVFQRLSFFDENASLFAEIFCGKENFNELK